MKVSEFCITAKRHPSQSPYYLGWPMYLPSNHLMHVHGLHGEYSVMTPYSDHHKSAQHTIFLAFMGYHPCQLYGGFLDGGVNQRIFGLRAVAPLKKAKMMTPHRVILHTSGQYDPEVSVHGRIIKKHLQNLVQCIIGCKLHHDLLTQSNNMIPLNI